MNLLEHYILKVYEVKELPEEYVDMTGMPGFEGRENYLLHKRWVAHFKINCYGDERDYEKTYFDYSEFEEDLKKGYFLA